MRAGQEPRWARKLRFWITDDQYEGILHLPDAHWQWKWRGRVEAVVLRAMCLLFGHGAIDDQCGIPEHRYCYRCSRSTPGMALAKWEYR